MEQELVNKMAEAIYNAQYASQGGKWYAVETKDVWEDIASFDCNGDIHNKIEVAQAVINYIKGE